MCLSNHLQALIKYITLKEQEGHLSPQKQCHLSDAGLWFWVYEDVCLRDTSVSTVRVLHVSVIKLDCWTPLLWMF